MPDRVKSASDSRERLRLLGPRLPEPRLAPVPAPRPSPSRLPSARPSRSVSVRRAYPLLALAVVVGVAIPVVLAVVTGSLYIPHNDGWAYSRIAQEFGRTGHLRLLDWNRSALVGQFAVLGPLARWIAAQQLFVAALAAVALIAAYDLVLPVLGRRRAGQAALLLAVWPGFGLLATSFMLDVPALAATLGSLALGRRAVRSASVPLLAACVAVGLWGATIREQTLAAPVAVLAAAWRSSRRRRRQRLRAFEPIPLLAIGCAAAALFAVFEFWRRSLGHGDAPAYGLKPDLIASTVTSAVRGYFTLALVLSPAVLLKARPRTWRRGPLTVGAFVALLAAMAVHDYGGPEGLFFGNYLDMHGAYPGASHGGALRAVIAPDLWWVLVVVAGCAGSLLAGHLCVHYRALDSMQSSFLLITIAGTLVTGATGQPVWDRYLMPLLPLVLVPVLGGERSEQHTDTAARRWRQARQCAALAMWLTVSGLSLTLTANALSYDAARWRAADDIVRSGVDPRDIDAGLEWVGYHSPHGVVVRHPDSAAPTWYDPMFSTRAPCFLVVPAGTPAPAGWSRRATLTYRAFALVGRARLRVYRSDAVACARPHASAR